MPIPEQNIGESAVDFIQRCMSDETMNTEYPDKDERYAVCIDQTKSKSTLEQAIQKLVDKFNQK